MRLYDNEDETGAHSPGIERKLGGRVSRSKEDGQMDEDRLREKGPLLKEHFRKLDKRSMDVEDRLDELARTINKSQDEDFPEGVQIAADKVRDLLHNEELHAWHAVRLHLYLGNGQRFIANHAIAGETGWGWEQPAHKEAIRHYKAAVAANLELVDHARHQEEVFRQLANVYSQVGRPVEALSYWRSAVSSSRQPEPVLAEMAEGLFHYGNHVAMPDYKARIFTHASKVGDRALESEALDDDTNEHLKGVMAEIKDRLEDTGGPEEIIGCNIRLGDTAEAHEYALWCLEERLYINPLNDVFTTAVASGDTLLLPPMAVSARTGLGPIGMFNILKQEFVTARYNFYQGLKEDTGHFSDQHVNYAEVLTLPALGYKFECVKNSLRTAYSLFDKIAFSLETYLDLDIENDADVTFRRVWYKDGTKGKGLREEFQEKENWPLRGLFWLSKDIFEEGPGFRRPADPDARRIHMVRNAAEHRYLALNAMGTFDPTELRTHGTGWGHPIGEHIGFPEFRKFAYRTLELAREALIYLVLAVYEEEQARGHISEGSQGMATPFGLLDDEYMDVMWGADSPF